MADILIRGMEMPASCVGCILTYDDGQDICCVFTGVPCLGIGRQDACPLIQLPEGHGRLIDADALERVCKEIADCEWNQKAAPYSWEYAYNQFIDDEIFNAPTIVPAEGGTDNG